jgi:hypothetical protein
LVRGPGGFAVFDDRFRQLAFQLQCFGQVTAGHVKIGVHFQNLSALR